jgi:hypothetical protein
VYSENGAEMTNKTQVQDLFEGAYLLCRGFKFTDLTVTDSNGRKIATFILSGKEVQLASQDYKSGRATANVKLIKDAVNLLRDAMNHKIRNNDMRDSILDQIKKAPPQSRKKGVI